MRKQREGRISNVRIISKHKTEKITSFRFFFEKDFYRQKGACVTSGGIFIDLSGVLRFPSALLCILNKTKSSYLKQIFLCDYLKRHIEIKLWNKSAQNLNKATQNKEDPQNISRIGSSDGQ